MVSNRLRGGKLRYVDSTKPEDFIPNFGDIHPCNISLSELADAHGSDKGTLKHNYCKKYETLVDSLCQTFQKQKNDLKIDLLEVGIACGASLRTWSNYLPSSIITGLDIREDCEKLCSDLDNVRIKISDATNSEQVNIALESNKYDLIIDDGSHVSEHITKTFELLWPRVKPGGFYAIEDLACTYNQSYTNHIKSTFGIDVENHRSTILKLLDALLRACDHKKHHIHSLSYDPQLLIIQKENLK